MLLLQVDPALVVDINFIKPNHNKPIDSTSLTSTVSHTQVVQQRDVNADSLYQALYQILPGACIFTSVPLPELESGPEIAILKVRWNRPDQLPKVNQTLSTVMYLWLMLLRKPQILKQLTQVMKQKQMKTQTEFSYIATSEPNQSCTVTWTADTMNAVCSA